MFENNWTHGFDLVPTWEQLYRKWTLHTCLMPQALLPRRAATIGYSSQGRALTPPSNYWLSPDPLGLGELARWQFCLSYGSVSYGGL